MPSIHKALGSIPSTEKKRKRASYWLCSPTLGIGLTWRGGTPSACCALKLPALRGAGVGATGSGSVKWEGSSISCASHLDIYLSLEQGGSPFTMLSLTYGPVIRRSDSPFCPHIWGSTPPRAYLLSRAPLLWS
jgi:hypothetical protein